MSVYPRGKKGIYVYDFQIEREPFFGSTGCTTKREALAFEEDLKKQKQRELSARKAARAGGLTFNAALDRLWVEVGEHYTGTYKQTVFTALRWLLEDSGIGANTLLRDIGPNKITEAVARRRGNGVSPSTVNRTVTELLRLLLKRARDNWEQDVVRIDWKKHLLDEPRERIRSLATHEEPALMDTMRDDYLAPIRFALKSGFRKKEVVNLKKTDLDWGNRTISVVGKGDKPATIPLSTELREILWPLQNHPTEYVFTYVAKATRVIQGAEGRSVIRGERYQITYSGLATAWRRFGPAKAGIADFRLHDLRHTAATRLARSGAHLKVVGKLLRHNDDASTSRYVHVIDADIRAAMEAETESRQKVPQKVPQVVERKA
jgi:integrase